MTVQQSAVEPSVSSVPSLPPVAEHLIGSTLPAAGQCRDSETSWDEIYRTRGIVQSEPMAVIRKALTLIPDSRRIRIFDAGCGTGRHSLFLGAHLPKAIFTCIDHSPESLRLIEEQISDTELELRCDVRLGDLDGSMGMLRRPYEVVVSTLVIHHGTWAQVCRRFSRLASMVRQNGLFAFAGLADSDFRVHTGYEIEPGTRLDTDQEDGDVPHHFLSESEIDFLFRDFEIISKKLTRKPAVTAVGEALHWEVLARKLSDAELAKSYENELWRILPPEE